MCNLKTSGSAFVLLSVALATGGTPATAQIIQNGGFESGLTSWTKVGSWYADPGFPNPHSGLRYAYFSLADGTPGNSLVGFLYQQFTLPANASQVTLSYWYSISTQETIGTAFDVLSVALQDSNGNFIASLGAYSNVDAGGYRQSSWNLSAFAGQTLRIRFLAATDASLPTVFRIDDVSVIATVPPTGTCCLPDGSLACEASQEFCTDNDGFRWFEATPCNPNPCPQPPTPPSSLTAIGRTSQVILSWQDNANNEEGYVVQRKATAGGLWGDFATLDENSTGYVDINTVNGTSYYYRVYAYNDAGPSPNSNESCGTPLAIPTLSSPSDGATLLTSSVTFDWPSVASANGYKIEVGTSCGANDIRNAATTASSYSTSLANGTYHWRVQAARTATCQGLSQFSDCNTVTVDVQVPDIDVAPSALNFTCTATMNGSPNDVTIDVVEAESVTSDEAPGSVGTVTPNRLVERRVSGTGGQVPGTPAATDSVDEGDERVDIDEVALLGNLEDWTVEVEPGSPCGTQEHYKAIMRAMGLSSEEGFRGDCTEGLCDDPIQRDLAIPDSSTVPKVYRLLFHVFCLDNGTMCRFTSSDINSQVTKLNADFSPWKISFIHHAVFHNDSDFWDFDYPADDALKTQYAQSPLTQLNVYVTRVVTSTGGSLSYATFPWSPNALSATGGIVMNDTHMGASNSTLTHEVGHCLGLWHTFHGVSEMVPGECGVCYEFAGAPSDNRGDMCSDTDPTPLNYCCLPPDNSNPCDGSQPPQPVGLVDPCNGNPWGTTHFRNYMGYGPSTTCVNAFTNQQAGRMHCWSESALAGWYSEGDCPGQTLIIYNNGQGTLEVNSISNPIWTQLNRLPPYKIAVGENLEVCLNVDCSACGSVDLHDFLTIHSNDPDEPEVNVLIDVSCDVCQSNDQCNNGNPCTNDFCQDGSCQSTNNSNSCDDGDDCTANDQCSSGDCAGTPIDCDDGIDCTVDVCSQAQQQCVHFPDDPLCGSGSFCEGGLHCDPVLGCVTGPLPDCDDGVACTDDRCDAGLDDCVHELIDALCRNGNPCDGLERCDELNGCMPGDVWLDATPPCGGTLSRRQDNILTLWFNQDLLPPDADVCRIHELMPDGQYGPDMSAGFGFEISDNRLQVTEQGTILENKTWYALRCPEGIGPIGPIEYHFLVCMGDANGDGFANFADLGFINEAIPTLPPESLTVENLRRDINGDNFVNFADLISANEFVGGICPAKPSGH